MIIHHFFIYNLIISCHLIEMSFCQQPSCSFSHICSYKSIFQHPATLQALGRSAKASAINLAASASRLSGSTESCSSVIGSASAPIGGQKWFEAREAGRMKINVNGEIISKPIYHIYIYVYHFATK